MNIFNKLYQYGSTYLVDFFIVKASLKKVDITKPSLVILLGGIGDTILAFDALRLFTKASHNFDLVVSKSHISILKLNVPEVRSFVTLQDVAHIKYKNIYFLKSGRKEKAALLLSHLNQASYHLNPVFDNISPYRKVLNLLGKSKNFYAKKHMRDVFLEILLPNTFLEKYCWYYPSSKKYKNIGIHVAGSTPIKNLHVDTIKSIIHSRKDCTFHIFGSKLDHYKCSEIKHMSNVVYMVGVLPLSDLGAYLLKLDLLICPDSMLMHLANELNVEVVALMGSSLFETYGPSRSNPSNILSRNPSCSPCSRHVCQKFDGHSCVQDIKAQEVLAVVDSLSAR